jgi:serine/threonine protein kinase
MPAERVALSSFLDSLRASGLLTDDQLDELRQCPVALEPTPTPLARVVFQRGWLTRFQLNTIAAGRAKDLTVGPYVLLDRLGEGGMGLVYKARHRHLQRVVALKVIRKEKLGSPEAVNRFFKEVQLAAALHHPNIVLAYDAGLAGHTHYFAMEYVEGVDLARLVKEHGPLPVPQACDYVRQAALGLQHAHEKGLVHRDVKPANLLVSRAPAATEVSAAPTAPRSDVVKLLDMGLARLHGGGDTSMTRTGAVIGTPDYLAPEQAMNARSADIRADLYSLGGTLCYLLTGKPPFPGGELTELLLKHQMEQPATLEERGVEAPEGVQAILDRLLAKRPEDRYQTPSELVEDLTPFCRAGALAADAFPLRDVGGSEDNGWGSLTLGDTKESGQGRGAKRERSGELSRTSAGARAVRRKRGQVEAAERRTKRLWLVGIAGSVWVVGLVVLGLVWYFASDPKPGRVAQGPAAPRGGGKPQQPAPGKVGPAPAPVDERPAPPPEDKKRVTFVDLRPKTNHLLNDTFPAVTMALAGNDLAGLKPGVQTLEGVKFNVAEGLIQLANKRLQNQLPEKVEGITADSKCAKLHILHATGSAVADGTVIAQYVIHYADRSTETVEVVYGEDVRDWWYVDGEMETTRGKIAWKGSNEAAMAFRTSIRLFSQTWINPKPAMKVSSIDYVSTLTDAAPFVVAITLEDE